MIDSFKKLHPRDEIKNLVMFVVWLGSIWTTPSFSSCRSQFNLFNVQICFWLWFTCLFANFAEAMAEGRGKAHADALRKMRTKTMARKLVNGKEVKVVSTRVEDRRPLRLRGRRDHSPPTAKSWKASPRWMNRPSRANRRRSCAKAAATAAP